jgi:crotonobetainyl-CoA:carnitine CoA-transferase CaiB-like acyl-CoA transferase
MVVDMGRQNGEKITTFGVPIKLSETPGSIRSTPVDFGESTVSILRELGYSENDITLFEEKGIF